jgi:DNA-binding transcriptional LysR family regulator
VTGLAEAIPRFLRLYPEISFDISVESALGPDLVAGGFDARIHAGEFLAREVIAVRVSGEIPIVVAAAPAYFAQRGEPKTPRELAAHDCIRFRLSGGDFFPWRFRIKRRTLEVHLDGRIIVNEPNSQFGPRSRAWACFSCRSTMWCRSLPQDALSEFSTIGRPLSSQDSFFTIRAVGRADRR